MLATGNGKQVKLARKPNPTQLANIGLPDEPADLHVTF
jgi:hypothetical protein